MPRNTATDTGVQVHRLPIRIEGDPQRTMMRFFWPGVERARHVAHRLMDLPDDQVRRKVGEIFKRFESRHVNLESLLSQNAQEAASRLQIDIGGDTFRQMLLGACMSMEYSIEAAALFNPSMVKALDQSGLATGQVRFLMSMRAVG